MSYKNWNSFVRASKNLKSPAHASGILNTDHIENFEGLLHQVIKVFLRKPDLHLGLKVYINNELRQDLIQEMASNPPNDKSNLHDWTKSFFGDQKFGMILIGLEQYSNEFAESAAQLVKPLLDKAGIPLQGLSFLFFMGNYGFTPFGIHKEATGEDGFLFHLGPEMKEFYTWDDPEFNAIEHNTQVFHNVPEMLQYAKKYCLEPGDAMFIPHNAYHVGNTPEFSLSFVMDYINPKKDQFENDLIEATARQKISLDKSYTSSLNSNYSYDELYGLLNTESIIAKCKIALNRKFLALKSNGYIRDPSIVTSAPFPGTTQIQIRRKSIFPILTENISGSKIIVFARGHSFFKTYYPELEKIVQLLNDKALVDFREINEIALPHMDLVEVFGFIQDLLSVEAIEVV